MKTLLISSLVLNAVLITLLIVTKAWALILLSFIG